MEARFNYRAYAGLGHAARCAGDYNQAKKWHEKQLEMALAARDKIGEGRACSNLGIVYQLLGEHDHALKLHQAHLSISRQLQDKVSLIAVISCYFNINLIFILGRNGSSFWQHR
ncbi:MAG: tetratricopeptide repeat protein [Runella slithyformis]|nr:MAG: tetratricopeptide repeat protein [Runella slithyformis]